MKKSTTFSVPRVVYNTVNNVVKAKGGRRIADNEWCLLDERRVLICGQEGILLIDRINPKDPLGCINVREVYGTYYLYHWLARVL